MHMSKNRTIIQIFAHFHHTVMHYRNTMVWKLGKHQGAYHRATNHVDGDLKVHKSFVY